MNLKKNYWRNDFTNPPKRILLIVDIAARKDIQRSGKEDSTRQGWRKIEDERKRERDKERKREKDRERDIEREKDSVVNSEQRDISKWFKTSFCP
jgi:hypothetical protein